MRQALAVPGLVVLSLVGSGLLALGCGSRTGLTLTNRDGGFDGAPPECTRQRDCDDGVECTLDTCQGGRCVFAPDDTRCEDGLFCNGPPRCSATGCVLASPVRCDDGVSCTEDACDEELDACVQTPNPDLCPISHRCDLERGCIARALVHDTSALYDVDLPSGDLHFIAPLDVALTDIALHPDGRFFGVDSNALFDIEERDGSLTWIANVEDQLVALEVGPDGALYGAGRRFVARIDPRTGEATRLGGFPPGWSASGDIAFLGGRFYVTATDDPFNPAVPDWLYVAALDGSTATRVGSIGVSCVWALAPFGETLYGLTCNGQLLEIDVATGAGRVLRSDLGIDVYGAAAR